MTIEELLAKHAKNFIAEKGALNYRPGLEGIQYNKNGSIYACNSHILLKIGGIIGREKTEVRHHKTGKLLDAEQRDFEKFMPHIRNGFFTIPLNMEVKSCIASLRAAYKAISHTGTLWYSDTSISVEAGNGAGESFNCEFSDASANDPQSFIINLNYLADILDFFADAEVEEVTISYTSALHPLHFKALNYEALLTPCRRH